MSVADAHGILSEDGTERFRGATLAYAVRDFAEFINEGVGRVATGNFGELGVAVGIEERWLAEVPPFPADNGELEHQRRLFQVDLKGVIEGAALLIDRAAGGGDRQIAIGKAELRVPEFRQVVTLSAGGGDLMRQAE